MLLIASYNTVIYRKGEEFSILNGGLVFDISRGVVHIQGLTCGLLTFKDALQKN